MAWYIKMAAIGFAMVFVGMIIAIESVVWGFAMAKTGLVALAVAAAGWLVD